eukprot:109464-Prorocentrum_minimum.AAC.3
MQQNANSHGLPKRRPERRQLGRCHSHSCAARIAILRVYQGNVRKTHWFYHANGHDPAAEDIVSRSEFTSSTVLQSSRVYFFTIEKLCASPPLDEPLSVRRSTRFCLGWGDNTHSQGLLFVNLGVARDATHEWRCFTADTHRRALLSCSPERVDPDTSI